MDYDITIRKATKEDLVQIKFLADLERKSLGFITRATILQSIEKQELIVAEKDNQVIGFQMYHHRIDHQTTLYKKTVQKAYRRLGIGRKLETFVLNEAKLMGQTIVRLKCPVDNESNHFHVAMGFDLVGIEKKTKRDLCLYEKSI